MTARIKITAREKAEALIEESSLGSPGAKSLRARTSRNKARQLIDQAYEKTPPKNHGSDVDTDTRPRGRSRGRAPQGRSRGRAPATTDVAAIRTWAKARGLKVADRGPIPSDVVEKYRAWQELERLRRWLSAKRSMPRERASSRRTGGEE